MRLPVERHRLPHDAEIAAEPLAPKPVAQQDDTLRRLARVRRDKAAPSHRVYPQHACEFGRYIRPRYANRIAGAGQRHVVFVEARDGLHGHDGLAIVEVVRVNQTRVPQERARVVV
jgi:hypothetical protein